MEGIFYKTSCEWAKIFSLLAAPLLIMSILLIAYFLKPFFHRTKVISKMERTHHSRAVLRDVQSMIYSKVNVVSAKKKRTLY